jgi:glycosyltransferase involved in cell wall biosynthesis
MHLALIHYLYPPTVGGVERVMAEHAALFARHGHRVTVLCGGGESQHPGVEVRVIPELGSGVNLPTAEMRRILEPELAGVDVVFVHNMMTMPFHPGATGALAEMAAAGWGKARFINWIHDLAATNPDYTLDDRQMALFGCAHPGFRHIAVSAQRQREFCALTGSQLGECAVIPNGIDGAKVLGLRSAVAELERKHRILARGIVLLQPARILRRKNIELGLHVTADLRRAGHDAFYCVTGAPDPHHPASAAYGDALRRLVDALDLGGAVAFAGAESPVTDASLPGLFALADAVFLPSRQEGFGLPVIESALLRVPLFCFNREPMASLLAGVPTLIPVEAPPDEIAALVAETLGSDPAFRARKAALRHYGWEAIYSDLMAPLLH